MESDQRWRETDGAGGTCPHATMEAASCQLGELGDLWGSAHLHVPSYQVRRLLFRLQGDVDGGERAAGHLLHLPQQLLWRREKKVKMSDQNHINGRSGINVAAADPIGLGSR